MSLTTSEWLSLDVYLTRDDYYTLVGMAALDHESRAVLRDIIARVRERNG